MVSRLSQNDSYVAKNYAPRNVWLVNICDQGTTYIDYASTCTVPPCLSEAKMLMVRHEDDGYYHMLGSIRKWQYLPLGILWIQAPLHAL